jgi:hypothetical protein
MEIYERATSIGAIKASGCVVPVCAIHIYAPLISTWGKKTYFSRSVLGNYRRPEEWMFQAKISLRPTQAERKLGAKAEALLVVLACHKKWPALYVGCTRVSWQKSCKLYGVPWNCLIILSFHSHTACALECIMQCVKRAEFFARLSFIIQFSSSCSSTTRKLFPAPHL